MDSQSTAAKSSPKFVITGNTLEECAIALAEAIVKTGVVTVKDTKSGKSKYGVWSLTDGLSTNPFDSGMELEDSQARRLATDAGAPLKLSVDVVLRQLTPVAQVAQATAGRKAATVSRIAKLQAQIASLQSRQ